MINTKAWLLRISSVLFLVTSLGLGCALGHTARPAGRTYLIPASIPGDCSRDVTIALTRWISSIPNGSTIEFGAKACYEINHTLQFVNRTNLVFDGNGATFRRVVTTPLAKRPAAPGTTDNQSNPMWRFETVPLDMSHTRFRSRNITIRDLKVVGTNRVSCAPVSIPDHASYGCAHDTVSPGGDLQWEAGFQFAGVDEINMTNISIDGVFGDGVTLGQECYWAAVRNFRMTNSRINRTGRMSVAVVGAQGVLLQNIKMLHDSYDGIDLESDCNTPLRNIEIANDTIEARIAAISDLTSNDASYVYIHNNSILHSDPNWPWLLTGKGNRNSRRHNWYVYNNTVETTQYLNMQFGNFAYVDIRNNRVPLECGARIKPQPPWDFSGMGGTNYVRGNYFPNGCNDAPSTIATEACDNTLATNSVNPGPPCKGPVPPVLRGWHGTKVPNVLQR